MDSKLFTPGPLTTSLTVKKAMLYDLGSRDDDFLHIVKDVRSRLTNLACHRSKQVNDYTTVLMQGSGTFAVESMISSLTSKDSKILILIKL